MSIKDDLGDRMKKYEGVSKFKLPERLPIIFRVDGKAFHTYTKGCEKPFDYSLINAMNNTARELCKNIQGSGFAYVQSDEISILVYPWKTRNSSAWFDNEIIKMVSVSAGIASATMTKESVNVFEQIKPAVFDSRVFIVPLHDIKNYFIWRQQDWIRNSVNLFASTIFSNKQLMNKKTVERIDMCNEKGHFWDELDSNLKYGRLIIKNTKIINTQEGEAMRAFWDTLNPTPKFFGDSLKTLDELIEKTLRFEE